MAKKKVKIEFIDRGFKEILRQQGVWDVVREETVAIKQRAGENFEADIAFGYNNTRPVGFVHSINQLGAQEEAENKTLSKAVK